MLTLILIEKVGKLYFYAWLYTITYLSEGRLHNYYPCKLGCPICDIPAWKLKIEFKHDVFFIELIHEIFGPIYCTILVQ